MMEVFGTLSKPMVVWEKWISSIKGPYLVILGAGSIIGGTVVSIVSHPSKIRPLCLSTGVFLCTVGGIILVEAYYKLSEERQKEVELELFRAQPSPVFMPQMKRIMELEMNVENVPYKMVEEEAVRTLKTASKKLQHNVDNKDVFCVYYSEYLNQKIALFEINRSQIPEKGASKASPALRAIILEGFCQSALSNYGKHIARGLAKLDTTTGSKEKGFAKFVKVVAETRLDSGTSAEAVVEDENLTLEVHTEGVPQEEQPTYLEGYETSLRVTNTLGNLNGTSGFQPKVNGHRGESNGVEEECSSTSDSLKRVDSSENGISYDYSLPTD